jgi:hypothetical protein
MFPTKSRNFPVTSGNIRHGAVAAVMATSAWAVVGSIFFCFFVFIFQTKKKYKKILDLVFCK